MNGLSFQVEHVGLAAKESTGLRDWYIRVFGAVQLWTDGQNAPAFLIRLPGGEILEIYPATSAVEETTNNKLAGWRHLALRVESLETAMRLLEREGVVFEPPVKPAGGGGRVIFFRDCEGNVLHLVERPKDWQVTGMVSNSSAGPAT